MKKRNLSPHLPMLLRRVAALLRVAPAVDADADLPIACDEGKAARHKAKPINEDGGDA